MANTDKPVYFDRKRKQFLICSLEEATQTFTTAPEGWYVELKNPAFDGNPPKTGTSNNSPEPEIGRKVNIPGPVFFALWPGQMARINQGHHLRSNQYLSVRVYDEDQARKFWKKAVIKTKTEHEDEVLEAEPDLTMGRQLDFTKNAEDIKRKIALAESVTKQENADLKLAEIKKELEVRLSETESDFLTERKQYEGQLESEDLLNKINQSELERAKAAADLEIERAQKLLQQKIEELQADTAAVTNKARAVSPDLVAALQAFSDRALAEKMAETMAPLSIIGGKSIAEVFANLLKGTALENVLLPPKKGEK